MERVLKLEKVHGLDQPFTLDVIIKDNNLDFCIDNRRTGILTLNERGDMALTDEERRGHTGSRLFLYARDGGVTIEDIRVRPLVEEQ